MADRVGRTLLVAEIQTVNKRWTVLVFHTLSYMWTGGIQTCCRQQKRPYPYPSFHAVVVLGIAKLRISEQSTKKIEDNFGYSKK